MTQEQKESIQIFLVNYEPENGIQINSVEYEVIDELIDLAKEREKLHKVALKLKDKNAQAIRQANKLMLQIIKSHGVKYDDKIHAVGISKSDVIYVGDKERIKKDSTAEPIGNDIVKAKLTRPERRKYDELLQNYEYINRNVGDHNIAFTNNDAKFISFEHQMLLNQEYDCKKQVVMISGLTGKVFLCDK